MNGERALPLLMREGLRLVFIGNNPGLESARRGHYYAFRGNVFWRQLAESGLVAPERMAAGALSCEDDQRLMAEAGIGFTDLCTRASAGAAELSASEQREGALRLLAELTHFRPAVAVFNGWSVFRPFARHALDLSASQLNKRAYGRQPETLAHPTALWVVPSSSGLASRWHGQRLELLRHLHNPSYLPSAW